MQLRIKLRDPKVIELSAKFEGIRVIGVGHLKNQIATLFKKVVIEDVHIRDDAANLEAIGSATGLITKISETGIFLSKLNNSHTLRFSRTLIVVNTRLDLP